MIINDVTIIYGGSTYNLKDYQDFCNMHAADYKRNSRVLVMLKRSPELIFTLLMLIEQGVTYIPLDPGYPPELVQYIIANSQSDGIISDEKIDNDFTLGTKSDVVYTIYTSGSTGAPKGVEITLEALHNFIEGISEIIDFSPGKKIACFTTVSFDIFFLESIMAIQKGLIIVLANENEQCNPKHMAKLIKDNNIDMIQMTPSRMQLLLNYDETLSCLKNVKEIMIGGEAFPIGLLQVLQERTKAKIYNMYGPTETTIWSTVSDLTGKKRIDIGKPIKHTEVYIVNQNLDILPDGQVGEICIAGKGLAKRYVGREDLTAERFCCLPQKLDVRVFRTGDIGRYLPDGNLECMGRADNQVKIRGYRVELEEIEIHLNQFDGIKQSIVIALETSKMDKVLVAYYTGVFTLDKKNIVDYLSSKLPEYMVPTIYKHIECFIQTANGKIDRKRVTECVEVKSGDDSKENIESTVLNDIKERVFEVISSTLDIKSADLTLETELTEVGFDSISFIKMVVALEDKFNFVFEDEMLLITKFPTIKSMIEYVESKANTAGLQ